MSANLFEPLVPASHRAAVERAVRQAFPQAEPEGLALLHGGLSGQLVLKLTLAGRAYVLRVSLAPSPLDDPRGLFAGIQTGADLGLAPAVRYADAEAGICITDFIASQPLMLALREPALLGQLGAMLRRLHHGPALPGGSDTLGFIESCWTQIVGTGLALPDWLLLYLERFAAVKAALRPHLTSAPCHNDLNPNNLLFDGQRLWIIDWEAAGMNEPLFDLANLLHWFALPPELERALLSAYFDADPDPLQRAQLTLARQVARCFAVTIFLLLALQRGQGRLPAMPERATLPGFPEALRGIATGTFSISEPAGMLTFSLVVANHALAELEQPELAQALTLLGA